MFNKRINFKFGLGLFLLFKISTVWAINFYVPDVVNGVPLADHANGNVEGSIQHFLNNAEPGDHVVLSRDQTYYIKGPLFIRNGVTLRGLYPNRSTRQKIKVNGWFPEDRAMITIQSGRNGYRTVLRDLRVDGSNIAWRIVDSVNPTRKRSGASNFDVIRNRLENTKNNFTSLDGRPYKSPRLRAFWYRLSILRTVKASNFKITDNILENGGLSVSQGKANGLKWLGFSDGINAEKSNNVEILRNTIKNTLTAGIRISGSTNVVVDRNTISWVARNVEWTQADDDHYPPFSDGITGYHNSASLPDDQVGRDLNWIISNNNVYHSGNHGIHVGGRGIMLRGSNVVNSLRSGIYFGDQSRSVTYKYLPECSRDSRIYQNRVVNSDNYLDGRVPMFKWRTPNSIQPRGNRSHDLYINRHDFLSLNPTIDYYGNDTSDGGVVIAQIPEPGDRDELYCGGLNPDFSG